VKGLSLARPGERLAVLCLGAHSDDIEIGVGGTILSWIAIGAKLDVVWCVASARGEREREARESAAAFLEGAQSSELHLADFRDGYLPAERAAVKDWVESLKPGFAPDVVLTHTAGDAHQDHRLVCELAWNTFRDHVILEFEVPKWDGDMGRPNVYVPLTESVLARKVELLETHFGTQRSKAWFDEETFRGLARLRGVECCTRYAEAFYARKLQLA
jgi:LmbE family N-acetylglucosaminyl deacetylase